MYPKISVCIPAYNRANVLGDLLDSIFSQDYDNFELVICEDDSPERQEIAQIVASYNERFPGKIKYIENEKNLGYDGNFRKLLEESQGEYCFFMGNDDLMCHSALDKVAAALDKYENVGIILRSYASFTGTADNIDQEFKYFNEEKFFPAGIESIISIFRRFVVISGLVIHRPKAVSLATSQFDGSLLYQLHLVANILTEMNAVFLPDILVLWRKDGVPDFGHSENEKGKFVPKERTLESSLHFMQGMLDVIRAAELSTGLPIYRPIVKDIANYSYPILAVQADKGCKIFLNYSYRLAKMGFWRSKMFFIYSFLILAIGTKRVDRLVAFIKKRLGHTPTIGKVYGGEKV